VEVLRHTDERYLVLLERLHEPGKVEQRPAESVDTMSQHAIDLPGLDIGQETLECRAVEIAAAIAGVVVAGSKRRGTAQGCNGERVGKGPAGLLDDKAGQEASLFKLYRWQGRTLWGMMLRDEQCLLDYLQTRPEVDKDRIAATGMSMGCTRSWWLAAIDDRIQAIVGIACFTRYTELIAHGNLRAHGIYYFVPGVFKHFDTEAVYALAAPRPMLMLSGDQDGGAPTDGIEVLEKKLTVVYSQYGKADRFRSVVYRNTGHEYLLEMKDEMVQWFDRHLPVKK
jgi:hypothetical protein